MPEFVSLDAIRGVFVDGTVDEFCYRLEDILDRPVVNETNLLGKFALHVESSRRAARNDFLDRLRDQLGLLISPAQRQVEMLVFQEQK
jgi:uncharacterized protein (TIGR03435 family)